MKTQNTPFRKLRTFFLLSLSLAAAFLIQSCSKDDDADITAHVMFVNSVEGSGAQDLYLDNAKVNSQAVAYTQNSGYSTVNSGSRKAEVKASGTTTVNASSNVELRGGRYYTVYYTGNGSANSTYTIEDDMSAPASGKAKVRFVHLSSAAASSVDVAVQGGAKLVSNLAYKAASAYYTVEPATNFQLFAAGSLTAALNLGSLNLQAGKIYTIYISGTTAATVSYHVVANN